MKGKKFNCQICIGVILSLIFALEVSGANYTWVATQEGADWLTPTNWSPSGQPATSTDYAYLNTLPGPTLYSGIGGAYAIQIGHGPGTNGRLDVYGGTLLAPGGCDIASLAGGIATMNVYGGTTHSIRYLCPGFRGDGTLNMYGGYIRVTSQLRIGYYSTSKGTCNLYGGTISAGNIWMAREAGTPVSMLVKDGVLLLDGDKFNAVQGYINNGWITAAQDYELVLEYNGPKYPGVTALYAVYNDLHMIPANKATVSLSTNQLQWTLPDPNDPVTPSIVSCDVYFGTDPNVLKLPKIVDKQAVESVPVTLQTGKVYYWRVDVYDSNISTTAPYFKSRVFTFNTFNVPPTVDAGADVQTWLAGEPRVIQMNGSASHVHNLPLTHTWTVLAEPDPLNPAVISNAHLLNPMVTVYTAGTYTLQLESTDGEFPVADTMQIVVYPNACIHASNQPGFAWLAGDINQDCSVTLLDVAVLSAQWLDSNYSIE